MNINWSALYKHVVVGLVAALGTFSALSAAHAITVNDWVSVAIAFILAAGGSATTSGDVAAPVAPAPIVLQSAVGQIGPDTSPAPAAAPAAAPAPAANPAADQPAATAPVGAPGA